MHNFRTGSFAVKRTIFMEKIFPTFGAPKSKFYEVTDFFLEISHQRFRIGQKLSNKICLGSIQLKFFNRKFFSQSHGFHNKKMPAFGAPQRKFYKVVEFFENFSRAV